MAPQILQTLLSLVRLDGHPALQRLRQALLTLYVVITFTFVLIQFLPGGPVSYFALQLQQMGTDPEEAQRLANLYLSFESDAPIWQQYIDYIVNLFSGDLGESILFQEPVTAILGEALPWTIFLMTTGLLISFGLGIVYGAFMAYNEGSYFDSASSSFSIFSNSVPFYVVAIIGIYYFGFINGWFPTGGRYGSGVSPGYSVDFLVSVLQHAALPIISLVLTGFGGWALSMRANSISVLGSDYIRVARLRGLSERRIALQYVARNAILPLYTGLLIAIGFRFGGAIILEDIFSYPGVGWFLVKAINAKDIPLLMGSFIMISTAVLVGVTVADFTYSYIDPRAGGDTDESF